MGNSTILKMYLLLKMAGFPASYVSLPRGQIQFKAIPVVKSDALPTAEAMGQQVQLLWGGEVRKMALERPWAFASPMFFPGDS